MPSLTVLFSVSISMSCSVGGTHHTSLALLCLAKQVIFRPLEVCNHTNNSTCDLQACVCTPVHMVNMHVAVSGCA